MNAGTELKEVAFIFGGITALALVLAFVFILDFVERRKLDRKRKNFESKK